MEIRFEAAGATNLLDKYPAKVQRATVRALNRALTTGKATMARLVAGDMKIAVGVAKGAIREDKATSSNLSIRMRASLKRIPLYDSARGVGSTLSRNRRKVPGSFVSTMPTGHMGVFKRRGRPRLPIVELYGPSIGRVFIKHQAAGIAAMRESFEKNLKSELKFADTEGA